MLIRRQVFFSDIDGKGVERLYSTTEVISEEDYLEAMFSERKKLKDYDSSKGIKRTYVSALMTGGGSITGRSAGEKEADRADEEGASDVEILRRAGNAGGKKGAKTGVIGGAILGAAGGLKYGVAPAITGAIGGAATVGTLGYFGGRNSSRIQTRDRLRKRSGCV